MRTITLKIKDDYFDKVVSFLEILPKNAIRIEHQDEKKLNHWLLIDVNH